ncbi:Energy-coupling factor transporter transmembrane protein EcfT [Moorella thermoacetica]|uniref:Energy-coupling factor transporter transmembrane protein EcfT n=1 Tax=Neomoorella thermoacetica TaxID=1525 RepID=A0AAC9HIP2_NEOTH|nr:cobalt ECF transporter T component CbiQ [Moorella thermoacetica]AOQ24822.1 Nickel transport protein NikQ [Moorella thermoacetica]TYL15637.1 Energy-coupling factor transporter transmembrane protein EcfT [Moorella thermoacetica]
MGNKSLPAWLLAEEYSPVRPGGRKRRPGFAEKTLRDLAHLGQEVLFSEELAGRRGWLQDLDPRCKLLSLLWLMVVAGLARHPLTLIVIYLGVILLAVQSRVPAGPFLKRVWLFVPLFTGIMVLPSLFNWVHQGDPLVVLFRLPAPLRLGPWQVPALLAITRQGLAGAGMLILRVGVAVSLGLLVTLTTRWAVLLRALRVLRVPRIFILTLTLTYRYIFLLLKLTEEMFVARQSRLVGRMDRRMNYRFLAGSMGNLLARAYFLSEEVYQAMLARGFKGEVQMKEDWRLTLPDYRRAAGIILAGIILLGGDHYLGW